MPSLRERLAGYHWIRRQWPKVSRKATWYLMPVELIGLLPCLVIFALAQPDLYRTTLWKIGYEHGLNSNPNMIVYAAANYRPPPDVPLVWSKTLTDLNVAISVLSVFFLLAKLIAFIMGAWYPILAVFVNLGMTVVYAVSAYGQVGPDYADPRYPAPAAWYFRQGCGLAKQYGKYKHCRIAQSSLGITLLMVIIYLLNLCFSAYAMRPSPINDQPEEDDDDDFQVRDDDEDEDSSQASEPKYDNNFELHGMKSPVQVSVSSQAMCSSPFTPRTQAFHTLDRRMGPGARRYA